MSEEKVKKLIERIEELEDKNQLLADLNESLTERINNVEVLERENRFLHECAIPHLSGEVETLKEQSAEMLGALIASTEIIQSKIGYVPFVLFEIIEKVTGKHLEEVVKIR